MVVLVDPQDFGTGIEGAVDHYVATEPGTAAEGGDGGPQAGGAGNERACPVGGFPDRVRLASAQAV